VKIELYDLMGRKLAEVSPGLMASGDQTVTFNVSDLGLNSANYIYQLQVSNDQGSFTQCKMMTAGKP
jgi:hypothetical protein